jgi:hypothetical protein
MNLALFDFDGSITVMRGGLHVLRAMPWRSTRGIFRYAESAETIEHESGSRAGRTAR